MTIRGPIRAPDAISSRVRLARAMSPCMSRMPTMPWATKAGIIVSTQSWEQNAWTWESQRPGIRNLSRPSITRAPAGHEAPSSGATVSMHTPDTTTVVRVRSKAAVPSMRLA